MATAPVLKPEPPDRNTTLASIAETVKDYRAGEIARITPQHIDMWVKQFDYADQIPILREMDWLLKRYYFSREQTTRALRSYVARELAGSDPKAFRDSTHFLDIQRRGRSQTELLQVVDEILREQYGFGVDDCGISSPSRFVYIDDGIFTGNRVIRDLTSSEHDSNGDSGIGWIDTVAPRNVRLSLYFLVSHTSGEYYVKKKLGPSAYEKHIGVDDPIYKFRIWNDRLTQQTDGFWPRNIFDDPAVASYALKLKQEIADKGWFDTRYRQDGNPGKEQFFSMASRRDQVEQAFLSKGVKLAAGATHNSHRPLGYQYLASFGFGTPFMTYRNIPNNTPLVLWWGGGGWTPLFQPKRGLTVQTGGEQRINRSKPGGDDFDFPGVPF